MKRTLSVAVGAAVLLALAGGALAFMGPRGAGMGMGMGSHMMGAGAGMGPGMMRGGGAADCPMATGATTGTATPIDETKAKELAQEYADKYLQGFTVEKVLPVSGRFHTMYSVELKGPKDEVRVLHINPFGTVMPFGGPWRRGA